MTRYRSRGLTILGLALCACSASSSTTNPPDGGGHQHSHDGPVHTSDAAPGAVVTFSHAHGLGFAANGTLFLPAHDGFRTFAAGHWSSPNLPRHDYMGYSATREGFYSSGHPDPASSEPNPFGVVKSTDGGKTLTRLAFSGQIDFHVMAVGYDSHAIYVFNPAAAGTLAVGPHTSADDGKSFSPCAARGLSGAQPLQLAVHPSDPAMVAAVTRGGLFLSSNSGDDFTRVDGGIQVTAAHFPPGGKTLLFGATELRELDLASKAAKPVASPTLAGAALSYIAVSPTGVTALATTTLDIYLSGAGSEWRRIGERGSGYDR
ncbi:MAG: glycosyl hydrolase [Deltaproteobacteria bacterium]|nr:glycosyl hydrolase [Deltaproteobacteria bacterium]